MLLGSFLDKGHLCGVRFLRSLTLFIALTTGANASPGAHGPNGEHLDTAPQRSALATPHFETFSETFEVFGKRSEDRWQVYVHDYATNTPVRGLTVTLETGAFAVDAAYNPLSGSYEVTAPDVLQHLQQPGQHDIVLTLLGENSGDLLSATLDIPTPATEHHHDDHAHLPRWAKWLMVIVALMLALLAGFWLGKRQGEANR
ncbi:hypothetical protein LJ739_02065 [Aestuariibacter halophilus]|uniref:Carboxypeptidase regulatory-like domain-containing protein n=1 Tax=Fluctibacter halophilus TaxID=226011 RepID=A0ABS8G4G3_9ALTE|nr:hypothetical protein [Aestuariibacter halophilus]MCC2615026.1 hypothetical protein [Aestuariibacter halophilus]